jgi:4-hydroxybenzoate polyprenyltransferase
MEASSPATPAVLSYGRLLRLPNVFTAMADVMMGFLVVNASLEPIAVFVALAAASSLLYLGGAVLNDVCDIEQDRRERAHRPLPAGEIPIGQARLLAIVMLVGGVLIAWLAGYLFGVDVAAIPWRGGAIATALAVLVIAYDAVLKRTPLGPIAMGGCRALNVLLGMSLASMLDNVNRPATLGFTEAQLVIAGGLGLYIAGVTWYARTEAVESNQLRLGLAAAVMTAGIVVLGLFPDFIPYRGGLPEIDVTIWRLLLVLLAFTTIRRVGIGVMSPQPARVQAAVKQCILSIIVFDAAVVLAVRDPFWAIAVLMLLVPTIAFGRLIYST